MVRTLVAEVVFTAVVQAVVDTAVFDTVVTLGPIAQAVRALP